MRSLQMLLIGLVALGAGELASAQEPDIPLNLAIFESKTDYERFADWIADIDNIRFALIQQGKSWSPEVETWVRDYVQDPAKVESNDGIYLITYAEGGLDAETAEEYLQTITYQYEAWLGRKQASENEARNEVLEAELNALEEKAAAEGIVNDVSTLQSQLAEVNQRLLEARLEVAQAEARVQTVMEHVESKSVVEPQEVREAEEAQRQLLESKLADAMESLQRATELHERGFNTEKEMRGAELKVMEVEAEIAELKAKAVRKAAEAANTDMRRMLIDAESARASALALERVLSDQEKMLRERIGHSLEHQRRVEELERKLGRSGQRTVVRAVLHQGTPGTPQMIRPEAREELIRQRRAASREGR